MRLTRDIYYTDTNLLINRCMGSLRHKPKNVINNDD